MNIFLIIDALKSYYLILLYSIINTAFSYLNELDTPYQLKFN
jgi:hypothetical protein